MKQVLTQFDWYNAMFDYIIDQLDGRFRVQFPDHGGTLDMLIHNMSDPMGRMTPENMIAQLNMTASMFGTTLTMCSLTGCDEHGNHELLREYINLIWDSRDETERWLHQQGIVPGRSAN
jgi:hypothetical protein